jgi:hypothetical protein
MNGRVSTIFASMAALCLAAAPWTSAIAGVYWLGIASATLAAAFYLTND